jgi:plasmid stabilization system protein ParE
LKIVLLDAAEQDLLRGSAFYERQERGLGSYFMDALCSDIDSLQLYAGMHASHFGFYRQLSRRFPFAIYYRISEDTVQVFAVLDCRQSPDRTADRLKPPNASGSTR